MLELPPRPRASVLRLLISIPLCLLGRKCCFVGIHHGRTAPSGNEQNVILTLGHRISHLLARLARCRAALRQGLSAFFIAKRSADSKTETGLSDLTASLSIFLASILPGESGAVSRSQWRLLWSLRMTLVKCRLSAVVSPSCAERSGGPRCTGLKSKAME